MLYVAKAQVTGYGAGTLQPNPNWTTGVHYMDDVRAKVTALSATLACSYELTLSNITGTFQVGDIALLIQMKGTGIGTHQNVVINTITANTLCVLPVGTTMHTYSFAGTDDRVQLIKINEYQNFTLGGGVVTCHPWNDSNGTGGILCMIVNGTLTINSGVFTVAAKGYTPEEAGVTFASGSAGGTPVGAWNGGSNLTTYAGSPVSLFVCNDQLYTTTPSPSSPYVFVRGQDGTKAGSVGASANLNTGKPVFYGGSQINSQLVMGDPGYYSNGSQGGEGGQGGGYGGSGANNNTLCGNSGIAGTIGEAGQTGGNAGKGGRGGGAMLIKASNINISTADIVFDASGQSGEHGQFGGNGGKGGLYGKGGAGCCVNNTVVPDAGNGGYGDVGAGGKGADGGNGGRPGFIWVVRQHSYSTVATNRTDNFRVKGGKGGKGGLGGWGNFNITPSQQFAERNPCTGDSCKVNTTCFTEYCDIDRIMCIIKNNATSCVLNGNIYEFKNSSGSVIAKYYKLTGAFEAYFVNSCGGPAISRAQVNNVGNTCNAVFDLFVTYTTSLQPSSSFEYSGTCLFLDKYPKGIFFRSPNALVNYEWVSANDYAILSEPRLNPNKQCLISNCYTLPGMGGVAYGIGPGKFNPYNNSPLPSRGNPGDDGEDADDGKITDLQEPDDNVIIDEDGNWVTGIATFIANGRSLQIYPQPVINKLNIKIDSFTDNSINCKIYDLNGKTVVNTAANYELGNYSIDISKLNSGVYIIEFPSLNIKIKFNVLK
jgi:hypothetical protein